MPDIIPTTSSPDMLHASILINNVDSSQELLGSTINIVVSMIGNIGTISYNFYKENPSDSDILLQYGSSNTYTIASCNPTDSGTYYCIVTDNMDSSDHTDWKSTVTNQATLLVYGFTTSPPTTTLTPTTTTLPPTTTTTTTIAPSTLTSKIKFTDIDVLKTKENQHYISWSVIPDPSIPTDSVDNYNFTIWYSQDPVGGYTAITTIDGAIGPLDYLHDVIQYNFNEDYYYKIELISKTDSNAYLFSKVIFVDNHHDGIHDVMRYNEELLYEQYIGNPSYVIKKKVTSARCPTCWSPYRQTQTLTNCPTCHSGGFIDSWYPAIKVQISYDSDPRKSSLYEEGEDLTNVLQVRMSNYPLCRPKDIIVNGDNYKRYIVTKIQPTKMPNIGRSNILFSKSSAIVSQIMFIKELNSTDSAYEIDVPGLV